MNKSGLPLHTQQWTILGLDCADCAVHLEQDLAKLPGMKTVQVDFINASLKIEFDSSTAELNAIPALVKDHGYALADLKPMLRSTLIVRGMDCPNESIPIQRRLEKMPGVQHLQFNLVSNQLIVEHQNPLEDIQAALVELGFTSEVAAQNSGPKRQPDWRRSAHLRWTVVSGLFAVVGMIYTQAQLPEAGAIVLFLAAILTGGHAIAKKGLAEARQLRLGMNFLMSVAVIGAMIIGEWSEGAIVVFLFSLAQLLESHSIARARKSIASLMELAPDVAWLKTASGHTSVAVDKIQPDDLILIKPGERIPLDGVVTAGRSTVNQAPITGESMPCTKTIGDGVFVGSINARGLLEVRVTKPAHDTMLSRIIRLVEQAQTQKAPIQAFVERFAQYYTPVVVTMAFLVAILPPVFLGQSFMTWLYRALVLLVISCPCALVISTPVTIVSGLTRAARSGILIKGGTFLETFGKLQALAFDKTGTLTLGKPTVQKIIPVPPFAQVDILRIAAAIEAHSEHPLAQAIIDYAAERQILCANVDQFEAIPGKGVRAILDGVEYFLGNHRLFEELELCQPHIHPDLEAINDHSYTAVLLGNRSGILGIIAIADALRPNARQALQALHRAGISRTIMLTGDNYPTAQAIARQLGIDEFQAELLPDDKVAAIQSLRQRFRHVAMVGDGINDAPALAAATLGISLGHIGSDTALETADIVLMQDDLERLAFLKALSDKANRIIRQNIFIALFLKALFAILAIPGLATLWMAVFADMGASLIVLFNGLLLLRTRTPHQT